MNESTVREMVDAIVHHRATSLGRPHELLAALVRKKLPGQYYPAVEPLLRSRDRLVCKQAIDIVGKMKDPPQQAAAAVEQAWNDTWEHGVPQACVEAFRALLRMGGNEVRLLSMVERALQVDNYGIHKTCAETLMQIASGRPILANWRETIGGKCQCQLHRKLSEKIAKHLAGS